MNMQLDPLHDPNCPTCKGTGWYDTNFIGVEPCFCENPNLKPMSESTNQDKSDDGCKITYGKWKLELWTDPEGNLSITCVDLDAATRSRTVNFHKEDLSISVSRINPANS